jgi:hypothetical protein
MEPGTSESGLSSSNRQRTTWSHNETLLLITTVESRYDDLHHPKKRKQFWERLREELGSHGIDVSKTFIFNGIFRLPLVLL